MARAFDLDAYRKTDLEECHRLIKPYIHRTPVLTSRLIDKQAGASIFFKCENFQRMGAYKMRGASHAILQLNEKQKESGVVTHSSGNFAQALALAAQALGVKAYIVMPSNAPEVKKAGVREYGGEIIECEPTLKSRISTANRISSEKGATFLHPSNDRNVILGQGTACLELLEEVDDLDHIVVPVGGGGLIGGTALAAHYFGKGVEVSGGEPYEVDDAYRSFKSGNIETNITTNTIADGLKTILGDQTLPLILEYVARIIRVEESEILQAMKLIWERMKIVVEPSSAVALAAVLKQKPLFKDKRVGIIISGGNVDLSSLPF